MMSTACRRGYLCRYAVRDDLLFLSDLTIRFADDEATFEPPALGRIEPTRAEDGLCWYYGEIEKPVEFGGVMVIGRESDPDHGRAPGFDPVRSFREVRELRFDRGRLMESIDRSIDRA